MLGGSVEFLRKGAEKSKNPQIIFKNVIRYIPQTKFLNKHKF